MATLAIPALIALVVNGILIGYAFVAPRRHPTTYLFVGVLGLLSFQDALALYGFHRFTDYGPDATVGAWGRWYFAIAIGTMALLLHLTLRLSKDTWGKMERRLLVPIIYSPVPILGYLLVTGQLVTGFSTFPDDTVRVFGPYYSLFETYVTVYLLNAVVYLGYGARQSRPSAINRLRNRFWVVGIAPLAALNIYLSVAGHGSGATLYALSFNPLVMALCSAIAAYATYQHRLFDVTFFIPWSKARQRKEEFHRRIHSLIDAIPAVRPKLIKPVLENLSELLKCPVVLIGGPRPVASMAGDAFAITGFPFEVLKSIDKVTILNEIDGIEPSKCELMRRHKVAVIVPFYPGARDAENWMLLGESFSEHVYSPRDFQLIESLFNRLSDQLLDSQALLRLQVTEMHDDLAMANQRYARALLAITKQDKQLEKLKKENEWLWEKLTHAVGEELSNQSTGFILRTPLGSRSLPEIMQECEETVITTALAMCQGNQSRDARLLGLNNSTLSMKIGRIARRLRENAPASNRREGQREREDLLPVRP